MVLRTSGRCPVRGTGFLGTNCGFPGGGGCRNITGWPGLTGEPGWLGNGGRKWKLLLLSTLVNGRGGMPYTGVPG